MKKIILTSLCLIFISTTVSFAISTNGINILKSVKLENIELILNGLGLRKKFGFKAYFAGLYLPEKSSDQHKIINADEPQALIMYWKRSADIRKIQMVFLKSLAVSANIPEKKIYTMESDFGTYSKDIKKFVAWVSETNVKKNHVWSFNYIPGRGLDVYIYNTENNIFKGNIPGLEFKKILWGVWIADNQAVGDKMKKDMLGVQ